LSAGVGSWAGSKLGPLVGGAIGGSAGNIVTAAIVGGTLSAVTGGKFANGAITAAFAAAVGEAANPGDESTPNASTSDAASEVSTQSNSLQVAQEILIEPPVGDITITPEGMTPLEELPPGSSGGPGAGKNFPRDMGISLQQESPARTS
jgi:hypothetical protein